MNRAHPGLLLRTSLLAVIALATGSMVFSTSSCTAIGFAIGGDNGRPPREVPAGAALTARVGTPLLLGLEDSSVVRGYYLGRVARDEAEYARAYAAWRAATADAPALGDSVVLVHRDGREDGAVFRGFAYRAVRVVSAAAGAPQDVRFAALNGVRVRAGRTWTRDELSALDAAGALPSREALMVGVGLPFDWHADGNPGPGITRGYREDFPDTARVPFDRATLVVMPGSTAAARAVGTLVGLSADLLVVKWAHDLRDGCEESFGVLGSAASATDRPFDTWAGAFVEGPAVAERPAGEGGPPAGGGTGSTPPAAPFGGAPSVAVPAAQ